MQVNLVFLKLKLKLVLRETIYCNNKLSSKPYINGYWLHTQECSIKITKDIISHIVIKYVHVQTLYDLVKGQSHHYTC